MKRRLGAGGMAAVFLAQDCRLEREVAIKRLHADPADDAAQRFQREAKLGASLNHPNIVGVYDTVTDDEGVLIVMEYVPGHTLRDEIARGRMEPRRAIEVLAAVASALDHAHEHGIVHRDVKPANVLIDDGHGTVKLADLGIATAAERTRITHSGAVLGTAAYMAPERLDGGAGGPSVDLYALAAMAFEMLSGRKAIVGSTPLEIARRVATAPPPDLREVVADAPEAAAETLRRGLAKDPSERPETAGVLVRELSEAYAAQAEADERSKRAAAAVAPEPAVAAAAAVAERPPEPRQPARRGPDAGAPVAAPAAAPSERPRMHRGSRRPSWLGPVALAAAGVVALAILAIALASSGGGDKPSRSAAGSSAAHGSKKHRQSSPASGGGAAAPAAGGQAASPGGQAQPPAAAPAPSGGSSAPGAPSPTTPNGAVAAFYKTSIGDPAAAWAMGTDNLHRQLGSEQSFAAQESTLRSIDFPTLSVASQGGDRATIAFRSIARHQSYTDRCHGTIDVVKGGSGWLVDQLHIAPCDRSGA